MDNEVAGVAPSVEELEVIKCNDIESCNSKRCLLEESMDRDNDNNDERMD